MKKKCPFYKQCGGCDSLEVAYPEQLFHKRAYIESLFPNHDVNMVIGMKDPYHYRHKVYATFGYDKHGELMAGLYMENTHKLIPSSMCLLQDSLANHIIHSLVKIAQELDIPSYLEDEGTGVLRHVYVRISKLTQQAMVTIVIGSQQIAWRPLVKKLLQAEPDISTIILNWNHSHTSIVLGKRFKTLYGKGYIIDEINGIRYRISPSSFYQVNPDQTERLYKKAVAMAQLKKSDEVLDVCCGIGTISLYAAKSCKDVVGVELNEEAVKDAEYNANLNHIDNAYFYCDDGRTFLSRLIDKPDVVFLDPPRTGMQESFMRQLDRSGIKRVVYISCNPLSQKEDISYLHNYEIKEIQPVDMFPFTKHVENVCLLSKIQNS